MELSRWRGRVCGSLSQSVVRLSLESISRSPCSRTVLAAVAKQLSGVELSGCGLPMACGKSDLARGNSLRAPLVDQHGWLVPYFHAGFPRCSESRQSQPFQERTDRDWNDERNRF